MPRPKKDCTGYLRIELPIEVLENKDGIIKLRLEDDGPMYYNVRKGDIFNLTFHVNLKLDK